MELPPPLIGNQLAGMINALLLGFLLAAGYDCYRAFRYGSGLKSAAAIFCIDFLFWVVATVFSLWHLFTYRLGEVVFPTYAGLATGALLYFIFPSRFLLPLWRHAFDLFFDGLKKIKRYFGRAVRWLGRPLTCVRGRAGSTVKKAGLHVRPFMSRISSLWCRK